MDTILLCIILAVNIIALIVVFIRTKKTDDEKRNLEKLKYDLTEMQNKFREEINNSTQNSIKAFGDMISDTQKQNYQFQSDKMSAIDNNISDKMGTISRNLNDKQDTFSKTISEKQDALSKAVTENMSTVNKNLSEKQEAFEKTVSNKVDALTQNLTDKQNTLNQTVTDKIEVLRKQQEDRFKTFATENEQKLDLIKRTISEQVSGMQEDNNKKLDEMRKIVDEKLQKTIETRMTESFKLVNDRLEQVYKGLGEMQSLATGVGDLKKVLTNVKTRGILGEIQLGAILKEILSPEQYEENVATVKGSSCRVEFAVKIPNQDGSFVYLPIDSKFPGDTYSALKSAYENGNPDEINTAVKQLISTIKSEAKDIHDKYIAPPHTTNFAIMFLPFEGLYAEVVNRGLIEELQKNYSVNIAGPSTMAALLNSLQMGFRTFAIQQRSAEVWEVLGAVKTEFDKFNDVLEKAQKALNSANDQIDKLVGTRTRMIRSKLKNVTSLSEEQSQNVLQLSSADYVDEN